MFAQYRCRAFGGGEAIINYLQGPGRATLLCLCILGAPCIAADAAPALDTAAVDRIVAEWLASTGAPSASIAIVRGGRLAYARAYGAAHVEPRTASTAATRYAIDSVSKEFTAAAILMLAERGKLSLDDPLSKWFPELGAAAAVTLRQLLTHTSGIRDYWPQDFVTPEMTRPTTTAAIIDEWVRRPLDFEPGTDWQYSNTGYVLAGAVVERVSGESLFEFLGSRVFAPLHMTHVAQYSPAGHTAHPVPDAAADPVPDAAAHPVRGHAVNPQPGRSAGPQAGNAAGYTRYGLGPIVPAPKEGPGWLFGAANLAMSPSDLALWDLSLINRSLLDADSYKAEFQPIKLKNGSTEDYALGLEVESAQGRLRIGHAGGGSGFLADNRIWPKERAAIAVLVNEDWADPAGLTARLAFVTLAPTPQEARARDVFRGFQNGTVDRGLFSDVGNFYLTASVLADLRSSLQPLGPARAIELVRESQRGGMTTRRWKILCRAARLEAIERSHPDGKIDEFMIAKEED